MTFKILLIICIFTLCIFPVSAEVECNIPLSLIEFLTNDTTDQNEFRPYYTCGHFSRDLARNAHSHNKTMGSAILSDNREFNAYDNHIINYVYVRGNGTFPVNGTIIFIEPRTDRLFKFKDIPYKYIKLYPDGTQVPSRWKYSMRPTAVMNGTLCEPHNLYDVYGAWN